MTPTWSGNPTNAVGGSFILSLPNGCRSLGPRIPPTQLVDRSYPAYKGRGTLRSVNPTNAVGGSFILSLNESQRLEVSIFHHTVEEVIGMESERLVLIG